MFFFHSDIEEKHQILNIDQCAPKHDTPNPSHITTPTIPHVRHPEKITNDDYSADSYNYPEYTMPGLSSVPPYVNEEFDHQNGYHELFYNENYPEQEVLANNYYPQTQRPFSASSSSCSSIESSEVNQHYNYTNLISFYGHNGQQNGRVENFQGNFGKVTPSPNVQEGGYTSVIVDNTQQFQHHGGSVNEFVH